eukprot:TRINITY_DN2033_c0_g1_i1.p2 TRINITY_DN2033_c0_g1~~TRINITY_DN2033_c0_g1_i1.p2  ORF type:complete len:105 (+),score=53.47 TRINITY_DN2033_c0_g1_i1:96-410(+)
MSALKRRSCVVLKKNPEDKKVRTLLQYLEANAERHEREKAKENVANDDEEEKVEEAGEEEEYEEEGEEEEDEDEELSSLPSGDEEEEVERRAATDTKSNILNQK